MKQEHRSTVFAQCNTNLPAKNKNKKLDATPTPNNRRSARRRKDDEEESSLKLVMALLRTMNTRLASYEKRLEQYCRHKGLSPKNGQEGGLSKASPSDTAMNGH